MQSDKTTVKKFFKNSSFDFVKNSKWFLCAAAVIFVVAAFVIGFVGFNLGMDFTGGTVMDITINQNQDNALVLENPQKAITEVFAEFDIDVKNSDFSVSKDNSLITVRFIQSDETLNSDIVERLNEVFFYDQSDDFITAPESLNPPVADTLLLSSLLAVLVSVLCMLIYVTIRFELASAASVVVTLLVNGLLMLSLTAIFRVTVNTTYIAALITVTAFSMYNSIILFDRIRENYRDENYLKKEKREIANISVREILRRTLITTLITFILVAFLAAFGVASVQQFAVPILLGLVSNLFTFIFIPPTLWTIGYSKRKPLKVKKETENADKEPTATQTASDV